MNSLLRQTSVISPSLQHCSGCTERIGMMTSTIRFADQIDLEYSTSLAWKFHGEDLIKLRSAWEYIRLLIWKCSCRTSSRRYISNSPPSCLKKTQLQPTSLSTMKIPELHDIVKVMFAAGRGCQAAKSERSNCRGYNTISNLDRAVVKKVIMHLPLWQYH